MADEKFDASQLSGGIMQVFDRPDLKRQGITADKLEQIPKEQLPYTQYGLDSRNQGIASLPPLYGTTLGGFSAHDKDIPGSSFIAVDPKDPNVIGHEIEHGLAQQSGRNINTEWDKLISGDTTQSFSTKPEDLRHKVVDRLLEHAGYLKKNWGVEPDNAYFSKNAKKTYGSTYPHLLSEQLASIAPWEVKHNKSFTDDPYVRENILTTPAQRETYNALTGLRQSRLDAKDLPPYTRQPEDRKPAPEPSVMDKLKNKLGLLNRGGLIDKPIIGGSKSI